MMRFALFCERGHGFEAWFGGNADLDEQRERGLVECPHCGSTSVSRALTTPSLSTGRRKEARREGVAATLTNARDAALREKMAEIARHVRENTTDVGERFPEEARRIHFGEAPEQAIRGRASADEVRSLVEDGVSIAPVPRLPEDAN